MKFDQDELVSCFGAEMLQYEYNLFIQYEKSSNMKYRYLKVPILRKISITREVKFPTRLTKRDASHDRILKDGITPRSMNIFTTWNCCSKISFFGHHNSLLSDLITNFKFFLVASSPVNPKISELILSMFFKVNTRVYMDF